MSNLIPVTWRESFDRLRNDIDRAFERWLPSRRRGNHDDDFWTPSFWGSNIPVVDMEEDDSEIRVIAELPGLEKDDFSVEVTGDRLLIRGEKKSSREEKKKNYFYSECSYGSFSRALRLPCEVDTDKIQAKYKNGVLRIRLPKSESAKARRIDVKVS